MSRADVLNPALSLFVHAQVGRTRHALVVGEQVIAWVERRPRPGLLLHTLARGASLKAVRVPAALDGLAVKAARVIGLDVAAVDLLEAGTGPMVFDVNSSPGLKGLEKATGKDLALPIVGRAEEVARR